MIHSMTEGERLMRVETKLEEQEKMYVSRFDSIEAKLDKMIEGKADKSELNTLNNRVWAILTGLILSVAGGIMEVLRR